jgi:lipopolysaccharide/colanic/teichoic acid biosynthesis glycosyltransferase
VLLRMVGPGVGCNECCPMMSVGVTKRGTSIDGLKDPPALGIAATIPDISVPSELVAHDLAPASTGAVSAPIGAQEAAAAVQLTYPLPPLSDLEQSLKRMFDLCAALCGLVVLGPLLLLTALAIRLDTPGPVLFRQMRHGYQNQPICVLKFRTLHCSGSNGFRQVSRADPRVTRVGRVLRIVAIDELPQLWNIIRGEMSVIGPRPHAVEHNHLYFDVIEGFSRRHTVKPGLTGWAQVNGLRGETDTIEKMKNRLAYDLYYIDHWSFGFDLKILLLTLLSPKTYTNAY